MKQIKIIINGQTAFADSSIVSYEDLIKLAHPDKKVKANCNFSITYTKGDHCSEGTVVKGNFIKVVKDMVFNITDETGI